MSEGTSPDPSPREAARRFVELFAQDYGVYVTGFNDRPLGNWLKHQLGDEEGGEGIEYILREQTPNAEDREWLVAELLRRAERGIRSELNAYLYWDLPIQDERA